MTDLLPGRDEELARLHALIRNGVAGRGGALLLRGPAGIGKTALLGRAVEAALAAGARVLTGSGAQAEYALGHSMLGQLLGPVAAEAARFAILEDLLRDAGSAAAPYAVARATLELTTTLAEQAPVVLVVDDLHHADPTSTVVLSFVGRRIASDPVVLIGAYRDDSESHPAFAADIPTIALPPLDPSAADRILRAHAPHLNAAGRHRILRESGGNPLALAELARTPDRSPSSTAPDEVPLTERLTQTFAARAAALPTPTRQALVVAALGDGGLDEVLTAASAVAGHPVDQSDLEAAAAARIIEPLDARQPVRFRHPLIRSAISQTADAQVRRSCHRALATLTADRPERRAWHRAAAADEPDERIATDLENAAHPMRDRGSGAVAHRMFLRAAELTVAPDRRQRRLMAALVAAADLGDAQEVGRLFRLIEPSRLDAPSRLLLTLLRGSYLEGGWGTEAEVSIMTETAAAVATDYEQALVSIGEVATRFYWSGDLSDPLRAALADIVDRLPIPADDPRRLHAEAMLKPVERGASVLRRLRGVDTSALGPVGLYQVGLAAQVAGDLSLSLRLQARAIAALRDSGQLTLLVHLLTSQSLAALLLGDARLAAACADEATRLAPDTGQPLSVPVGQILGAAAAGLRGDVAAAETLAAEAEQILMPLDAVEVLILVRLARGITALGGKRPEEAYEQLRAICTAGAPGFHVHFRLFLVEYLAEAAVRAGRHEELDALVRELAPVAEQSGFPALVAGLRYAAAVRADDERADEAFHQALSADEVGAAGRAHLQLAYGRSLRRRRRLPESRQQLRAAMRTYDALGLGPWSELARAQLRASGERVAAPQAGGVDRLTPQEMQIAALAAQGFTNRDIGQRLYLSPRTIGSHLYRVFPKLGITSRTELAQVLGATVAEFSR
ncbi:helix-turn-helix transcriptional regulator [Micromonospora endophytica]|uniref:LuxR family transcriptional regulator n=1 Tax=Micromonospora endophytica TaxID=515350 RepID=A0A2W2DAG4_9ACTN|nr:LuxR family transcriptional regulator [Micromonospora endophytica]PZG00919.1 LuxR family transcriptional regulator [Micromonospora endophytica]RIW46257.1 helix-turn-helix transcriptional regulator [Micromonospora endophytica]BCJ61779.1 LuxR family transcriptional regulator [Micromonospora endophytica]